MFKKVENRVVNNNKSKISVMLNIKIRLEL